MINKVYKCRNETFPVSLCGLVGEVEGWGLSGTCVFEVSILKVEKVGGINLGKGGLSSLYCQTGYTGGFFPLIW